MKSESIRCFCGHLARSHSPFKEITVKHESAWQQVEITSCKWCDKALLNLEVRKALSNSKYTIRETKTEEKALPPHPVAEKKPKWMRDEEMKEFLGLIDELRVLDTLKKFFERNKDR